MWLLGMFVFSVFAAQLVRVQAFDASAVQEAALTKRLTSVAVPALRGSIVDSKGTVLAASIERRTVSVNQDAVRSYTAVVDGKRVTVGAAGAAQRLAPLLGTTPEALAPQLTGTDPYRIIAKNVSPLVWRQIAEMGIPGIHSETTFQREYPAGMTAASLVGVVVDDETPGAGIEVLADAQLSGTPGKQIYQQARDGEVIPWAQEDEVPARDGSDVHLTIDADLQWFAQNEIANQVIKTQAQSGYIVVQEVKTGKLRAVASYPSFDPTDVANARASLLQSQPFTDVYEPGSTGKVMSYSAALEEGVAEPTTGVIVPNRLGRSDRAFKDYADHPTLDLTVAGALVKSSNIGTILVAEQMPAATIEKYFRAFGLGERSAIGFPGESAGLLTPADELNGSQRYTMLFGQGYSLTAIQATGVFQTIANGGVRVSPSLIEQTVAPDGAVAPAKPAESVRVISEETATTMSRMLEQVTQPGGTATKAAIPGYRVAGKTGTANRFDDEVGGYHGYTVSFIGFAPAEDPRFVVSVTMHKPTVGPVSGGRLCGPVFASVMTYALQSYQVPPTGSAAPGFPLVSDEPLVPGAPGVISDRRSRG
ncbi:MAG: hypothetical protein CSA84_07090 [Actinomycetales bacterium]|nr:MAG: hypothetical protein CSA84_07090 [Actinomycetales bacterium]